MSSEVPEGWELSPLSSLADYMNGRAFKPSDWSKSGLPILRIAQMNNPHMVEDYYDGNDVENIHFITKGDLIFSWSATLKAEIWSHYDAILNQHIFKVIEKVGTNRSYLHQLLDYSIPKLAESSHGSTMKHIKKGVLEEFFFPVPPLPEQEKIASILTSVDEVIENTQKQIDKLQDLKKATMNELLTKGIGHTEFKDSELGRIPKGWEITDLGECFTLTSGKSKPTRLLSSKKTQLSNVPVYGGNGVTGYTDSELLKEQTIVIGRVGENCGCVHLTPSPCWITDNALYIKSIIREFDLSFMFYLLAFSDLAQLRNKGGQPLVSQKPISEFVIALPSIVEQQQIASCLDSISSNIHNQSTKLSQTQSLKKSLMQDLLTGKVRVTVN